MTLNGLIRIDIEQLLDSIQVPSSPVFATPKGRMLEGRNQARTLTPKRFLVHISSVQDPFLSEVASVENVSSTGVRVATGRSWEPGSHVNVKSVGYDLKVRARVVYCKATGRDKFAVGLNIIWAAMDE